MRDLNVSNGFHTFIEPIVTEYGIKPENIFANQFNFDEQGNVTGFNKENPLSANNGAAARRRGQPSRARSIAPRIAGFFRNTALATPRRSLGRPHGSVKASINGPRRSTSSGMMVRLSTVSTNIVFAACDGDNIVAQWRASTKIARTADEYGAWLADLLALQGMKLSDLDSAIIACVVPSALFDLRNLCIRYLKCEPLVIGTR